MGWGPPREHTGSGMRTALEVPWMENLVSKIDPRRERGSSLTLIVVCGLAVVTMMLYLAVIYTQQFTHQKEAQTAVDSAAIAVAKELSLVTVRDPNLGLIGVTDQYQAGGPQQQVVYGINTLTGRARLDSVIARSLNNTDMQLLSNRDAQHLTTAVRSLRSALVVQGGVLAYTNANGARISRDLRTIAAQAYNNNPTRAENSPNVQPADVTIELGYLNDNNAGGLTDIPIPSPANQSEGADNNNFSGQINQQRFYKAGVNVPVSGMGTQFVFSPIGKQPRLVDRQVFVNGTPNGNLIPSVVRVSINQRISRTNPKSTDLLTGTKREVACATAGGERLPTTAGLFRLEFPQGIPQDQGSGDTFKSILAIMNAPDSAWRGKGDFFTARNGPFPGVGFPVGTEFPSNTARGTDANLNPRRSATPGEMVSYYVYDWLRNDCLRPNVQSVKNALGANLRTSGNIAIADASKSIFDSAGEIFIQKAWAQSVPGTPAQCNRIWGAIYDITPDSTESMRPNRDPRSLNNYNASNRNDYIDQAYVFRMQASAPQQVAFTAAQPGGRSAIAIGINQETGCPTTTNGFPLSHITDLRQDLGKCNDVAMTSYEEAEKVREAAEAQKSYLNGLRQQWVARGNAINAQIAQIDALLQQLSGIVFSRRTGGFAQAIAYRNQLLQLRAALVAQLPPINAEIRRLTALYNEEHRKSTRAIAVERNAIRLINDVNGLINNLLAVSSIGIQQVVPGHYKLAERIHFFPITQSATQAQVRGFGPIPDGGLSRGGDGRPAPGDSNWVGNPMVFSSSPQAVAQISCPPSTRPSSQARNFELITVKDGSLSADGGGVMVSVSDKQPTNHIPNIPAYAQSNAANYRAQANNFQNVTGVSSLLEGQSQYQNLNGYAHVSPCDDDVLVVYSAMGQDNAHNLSLQQVDLRSDKTRGNKLDCGRANAGGSPEQKICDTEAVRVQFTTPTVCFKTKLKPYPVPKLPSIQYQPPAYVNYPGPPPAPPRQGH